MWPARTPPTVRVRGWARPDTLPLMSVAPRLATYDDLLALPGDVRAEVIAGQIVMQPSPLPRHSRISGAIRARVGVPFDDDDGFGGPGGWWIFQEVDVRFSAHDIVRPDLSGWQRTRLADPWEVRPIDVRPDWVCEILSPSNRAHDRVTKRDLYRAHEIPTIGSSTPMPGCSRSTPSATANGLSGVLTTP